MDEIRNLLKKHVEDYENAYCEALKYVEENRTELAPGFTYARYLKQPLQENQIFFLWDNKGAGSMLVKGMMEYVLRAKKEYVCVCCAPSDDETDHVSGGRMHGGIMHREKGARQVEKGTGEYWEALAVSGYLISNVLLPLFFVKREGQVYFNTMTKAGKRKDLATQEGISRLGREFLKTDYVYAASRQEAQDTWQVRTGLGRIYDGEILIPKDPKDAASAAAERILSHKAREGAGNRGRSAGRAAGMESLSLRDSGKKKLLILTNWKARRQEKMAVKSLLEQACRAGYEVAALSVWVNEEEEAQDFLGIPGDCLKLMGRGRMAMEEDEYINYRILLKNPDAYVKSRELRRYMDGLSGREWQRLTGSCSWDAVVAAGGTGYRQYYLAAHPPAEKRVLADADFLPGLRRKEPEKWKLALTVFDQVYAPASCQNLEEYAGDSAQPVPGGAPSGRVKRLPVVPAVRPGGGETVTYNGCQYLVMDTWKKEAGRTCMKLIRLPEKKSILVNAELPPEEKRQKQLADLAQEYRLCLLGSNASGYLKALPGVMVLGEAVCQELYLFPAAWTFFGAFEGYAGDPRLDYDALGEICKAYGLLEIF